MRLFVLTFLVFLTYNLLAQRQIRNDSSVVVVRSVNGSALQKYRQDKEFRYEQTTEPQRSAWDRFWDWVWFKIDQVLSTKRGRVTTWTLLIVLAIAVLVYFIITVAGMNRQGLFGRSSKEGLNYGVTPENIHDISFDAAISQAISMSDFRLALRLLYLQSLKKLSDKGYISWEVNKTNSDYLSEVYDKPWQDVFRSLTHKFEYIWYGEMNLGGEDFERLQLQFQQFNNKL